MVKRKGGRPKLPDELRRVQIPLKLRKPLADRFTDAVASLKPRTTVTAVIEMLMEQFINEHEEARKTND